MKLAKHLTPGTHVVTSSLAYVLKEEQGIEREDLSRILVETAPDEYYKYFLSSAVEEVSVKNGMVEFRTKNMIPGVTVLLRENVVLETSNKQMTIKELKALLDELDDDTMIRTKGLTTISKHFDSVGLPSITRL